jgi:mono/diheme cytochrome c family protein
MRRNAMLFCVLVLIINPAIATIAQEQVRSANTTEPSASSLSHNTHAASATAAAPSSASGEKEKAAMESSLRIEGEKRFRTNCSRCHMAPHKFPPRVMATAVRHMRVRATLTDEDMRFILYYLTR